MPTQSLTFHETFPPEREHIARLLLLADEMDFMTKEDIFAATGIPTGARTGKVIPHIRYAQFMGLIDVQQHQGRFVLTKTELGRTVSLADPFLMEPLSQLLCHYFLTSTTGAMMWQFVFREFIVTHGMRVNRADIIRSLQPRSKAKVNISPFASCYTRDTCFGQLDLLEIGTDRNSWQFKPHVYDRNCRHLYAFTLLREWDHIAADEPEITLDDLNARFRWGAAFVWDTSTTLNVLSNLQESGVVRLNQQLHPITVIRMTKSDNALRSLYSSLV